MKLHINWLLFIWEPLNDPVLFLLRMTLSLMVEINYEVEASAALLIWKQRHFPESQRWFKYVPSLVPGMDYKEERMPNWITCRKPSKGNKHPSLHWPILGWNYPLMLVGCPQNSRVINQILSRISFQHVGSLIIIARKLVSVYCTFTRLSMVRWWL